MALTKYKLGELIYGLNRRNTDLTYGIQSVRGISNSKKIMPTKADVDESVLHKFYVIYPGEFIYNPRTTRMGEKVGLAYNDTDEPLLFTFNNIAFAIKDSAKNLLLGEYLYMFFNRSEFDRYAIKNSWGSATELFTFEEMCDIDIELPDLATQQKYVDIYKGMVANQAAYERGLEDLKLACDAVFTEYKKDNCQQIKNLITVISKKNNDNKYNRINLRGINEAGEFVATRDTIKDEKLEDYLVIPQQSFAVNFMCLGNFGKFYLGFNDSDMDYIVSPACQSFTVKNNINPYYFRFILTRSEFQRRCVFYGSGNTRGGINITDFGEIYVPVPSMEVQNAIADLFAAHDTRRRINEQLKQQIKNLCPILIRGAVEEAARN